MPRRHRLGSKRRAFVDKSRRSPFGHRLAGRCRPPARATTATESEIELASCRANSLRIIVSMPDKSEVFAARKEAIERARRILKDPSFRQHAGTVLQESLFHIAHFVENEPKGRVDSFLIDGPPRNTRLIASRWTAIALLTYSAGAPRQSSRFGSA